MCVINQLYNSAQLGTLPVGIRFTSKYEFRGRKIKFCQRTFFSVKTWKLPHLEMLQFFSLGTRTLHLEAVLHWT